MLGANPQGLAPLCRISSKKTAHAIFREKVSLQFTESKPQKNYSAAKVFSGWPSLVICYFVVSEERAKEKGPPTKAPLLLAMDPTWNGKTIKTTGEWGSTSSAPRPALQDHSSTQGKKCQAFCCSKLRQATLAHLFAGAVKAGAPEAFTAPAKMEGGKAAGRNAPRGAQPTAGGRSPAISPALPGSPQRGRQGRGGSRGEQGRAKRRPDTGRSEAKDEEGQAGEAEGRAARTSKAKAGHRTKRSEGRGRPSGRGRRRCTPRQHSSTKRRTTKRTAPKWGAQKRPGALSPKPGFAGLCPGAGDCRMFRRGIAHHCRQETLVRGSGFGPGKRRHLKHPAQGRLCRLLCPCAGC